LIAARAGFLILLAGAVAAQAQEEPISAIDWLSKAVNTSPSFSLPPSQGIETEVIAAEPLGAAPKDAAGLIAPETSGLPRDLWAGATSAEIARAFAAQPNDQLFSARSLLFTLLLAELAPPADAGAESRLFLARIDKLLELGALDRAEALLEQAGPDTQATFARWFDTSLLTGYEDRACAAMLAAPEIAPTPQARIFCLARGGDWAAADLLLRAGTALGTIAPEEAQLIDRFLDPELFEGEPDLPAPDRLTPLDFKMREATAQPRPARTLPLAFAWADLSPFATWRAQLLAAERLARTGAVPPGQLMALYTGHKPSASGGLWDRVDAVQSFDIALLAGESDTATAALSRAWQAMKAARLAVPFARYYRARLASWPVEGDAAPLLEIALLGGDPDPAADRFTPRTPDEAAWIRLATGQPPDATDDPLLEALGPIWQDPAPSMVPADRSKAAAGRGLDLLSALAELSFSSEPTDFAAALGRLRALGYDDLARSAALERAILGQQ
jgi:hypothetical protein